MKVLNRDSYTFSFMPYCRACGSDVRLSVCLHSDERLVGGDTKNAALHAGFWLAAFSLAESLTSLCWGVLSDLVGRKPVLLLGLGGTLISMLVIGFSTNIWVAVIGRFLGGALNGNQGVVQTIVGELVTNPKHECKSSRYRQVCPVYSWFIQLAHMPLCPFSSALEPQ